MAIIDGKPGKYARAEADKRMNWIVMVGVLVGILGGFLVGLMMDWRNSIAWWAIAMTVLAGLYFAAPLWLYKPLTILGRQRIKYLRGAQGEALVG